MARKPRIIAQGLTHHCFSRCHNMKNLLKTQRMRQLFKKATLMAQNKYTFELNGIEVSHNHFHLIIRTLDGEADISRIVQYIKARTAEMYNRKTGSTGAFWNERYGNRVIEMADKPEQYCLYGIWYVAYNAVREGLVGSARKSDFGFINHYLDREHTSDLKITLHYFFTQLGDTFEECVRKFLLYEEAYLKRLAVYF